MKHINNLIKRAEIIRFTRSWFEAQGFLESDTPILVNCPDLSPNLNILETKIEFDNEKKTKYLISSPEFSMKKLLSYDQIDKIFTISKVFRNKEANTGQHRTEFTMLEWYRKNSDYQQIMKDTEKLILSLNKELHGSDLLTYQHKKISLALPWPRISLNDLFEKYLRVEAPGRLSLEEIRKLAQEKKYSSDPNLSWEQAYNLLFFNEIEKHLPQERAYFLLDYPKQLAALAKLKNAHTAERFEAYIADLEICNAFSELCDGQEQLKRFEQENKERAASKKKTYPIDKELCARLDLIGTAGGNALGIDRLVMLLCDATSIDEVTVDEVK